MLRQAQHERKWGLDRPTTNDIAMLVGDLAGTAAIGLNSLAQLAHCPNIFAASLGPRFCAKPPVMIRTLLAAPLLCLAIAGCSESTQVSDDLPDSSTDLENPTGRTERVEAGPSAKPVRIGEGGPRFDACQSVGEVGGHVSGSLPVLSAPFDAAERKDSLAAGQRVYICTRSIDQQWFGIVYDKAPAAAEGAAASRSPGNCGVSSPVRAKRNYDGPCQSGWVESIYVVLVAG